MKVSDFESYFDLAGYHFGGTFHPPVIKKNDGTFQIRILKESTMSRTGISTVNYEYFYTDKKGVITQCPRGLTKEFKGRKVEDVAKVAKELATKDAP